MDIDIPMWPVNVLVWLMSKQIIFIVFMFIVYYIVKYRLKYIDKTLSLKSGNYSYIKLLLFFTDIHK